MSALKLFLIPEERPQVAGSCFIAEGAVVVGGVKMAADSSVWYGAVLRGDINWIHVGEASNVQDGAVVHVSDEYATVIGDRVTVGHRAIVHACTVEAEVLVGMGAILLDGCVIGAGSVVAAGALVPKGMVVPPGSLVMGLPARVVRPLSGEEQGKNGLLAAKYVEVARRFREQGLGGGPTVPQARE